MSQTLQDTLYEAVTGHGLAAAREGNDIVIGDGLLRLGLRTREHPKPANGHIVQLDVEACSTRLGSAWLIESCAGVGATLEEAGNEAFRKFLMGSFHVLIEALADHSCDDNQGDWLSWQEAGRGWRVCSGPLLLTGSEPDRTLFQAPYAEFFERLEALFRGEVPAGPHWARVFICAYDGQLQTVEVLLDNDTWPQGEALARSIAWATPERYTTLRHFLIALAETGQGD